MGLPQYMEKLVHLWVVNVLHCFHNLRQKGGSLAEPKNALQKIFQRSQQQVEPGGTFFHIFTCSGCATIHNPNFRATINGAHGAHMVRPILPPRPGWSLHLAQAQWLCQKINGKQGQ